MEKQRLIIRLKALGFIYQTHYFLKFKGKEHRTVEAIKWVSNLTQPVPTPYELSLTRKIDYLSERITQLVPRAKAEYYEDDYYLTVWNDDRAYPSVDELLKVDIHLIRAKQRKKLTLKAQFTQRHQELTSPGTMFEMLTGVMSPEQIEKQKDKVLKLKSKYQAKLKQLEAAASVSEVEKM